MTMVGTDRNDERLLTPIRRTLAKLIWRTRLTISLRGIAAVLAAALIGILVAMGIAARWPIEEAWQDYALTGLWVVAAGATAYLMLVRPLARAFTLSGIARVIEQRHPELKERISSAFELLTSEDSPEVRGSEALIRALATEAVQDAGRVQPKREVTFRKARPPLILLAAAILVIASLVAISPHRAGRLLAKTVVPALNLPNFYAKDLHVTPGAKVLAEGERHGPRDEGPSTKNSLAVQLLLAVRDMTRRGLLNAPRYPCKDRRRGARHILRPRSIQRT
ncbi:hypothetical protein LCGC14_2856290 [marine sediment metagenome]|uniref:Uncharacterized protein n=1 Tax=marine sediment metagenome TaxID=412755 RepID=A0A0F8Y6T4_9ZZZZ